MGIYITIITIDLTRLNMLIVISSKALYYKK